MIFKSNTHFYIVECLQFVNCDKAKQYIVEYKKQAGASEKMQFLLSGSRDK